MTNIPFPNPHDADALNEYLDALAAGTQAAPDGEVQRSAQEFHQLASRAVVSAQQQPIAREKETQTMQTATMSAPISNRTRRQLPPKQPGRSYGWISAAIVAALLLSMFATAWFNREPANPNSNVAFAPGTAEAMAECPVTLPNNVGAPGGLDHYAADGHTWFENGIWISIPTNGILGIALAQQNTNPESANFGWGFEKLIVLRGEDVDGMITITGRNLLEESADTPYNDTTTDQYYGTTGFVPIALMIPGPGCWEFTATAGNASATWVLEVKYEAPAVPWTNPISYSECPQERVVQVDRTSNPAGTAYALEDYEGLSSDRNYTIFGPADPGTAQAVVTSMRQIHACGMRNESIQAITARFEWENRTTAGRESLAGIEDERSEASGTVSVWLETELGLTPMNMLVVVDPAELELHGDEALITQGLYNPAYAVQFADGRIGIIPSGVYYNGMPAGLSEDTFPGFAPHMSIFVYQDGEWLLDENLPICIGDCSAMPSATPVQPEGETWGVTIGTPED